MTDPELAEVLARLQRLEDAEAARNHLHAYASTLDDPTPETVGALFTEDGSLHVPSGSFVGRDAVMGFYRDRFGPHDAEKRHFLVNVRTRHLSPGLVEVASYFVFTGRNDKRSALGWGTYVDRIRVVEGEALFESKVITPHVNTDLTTGWPA